MCVYHNRKQTCLEKGVVITLYEHITFMYQLSSGLAHMHSKVRTMTLLMFFVTHCVRALSTWMLLRGTASWPPTMS